MLGRLRSVTQGRGGRMREGDDVPNELRAMCAGRSMRATGAAAQVLGHTIGGDAELLQKGVVAKSC